MNVSVLVCSFGADHWRQLAMDRAVPSAERERPMEVLVVHERRGTLAEVRNCAAEQARGEMLCFLDADDELAPGYLQAMQLARAREAWRPEALLLTPAVQYVTGRRRATAPRIWPEVDLRDGNWLVIGTLVSRQLFLEVGGFEEWPLYEDWALWARCWKAGAHVVEVPDAVYVAHAEARSRNRRPSRQERVRAHDEIRRAVFPELYQEAA